MKRLQVSPNGLQWLVKERHLHSYHPRDMDGVRFRGMEIGGILNMNTDGVDGPLAEARTI